MKSFPKSVMRETRIDGYLPAGTSLRGTLEFSGTLWVDAEIHGDIRARVGEKSTLIIGPQARIFGHVEAAVITVYGKVTGSVRSTESLLFEQNAHVIAEVIVHNGFTIRSGAHVEGALVPTSQPQESATSIPPGTNVQILRTEPPREASTSASSDRQLRALVPVSAER